MNKFDQLLTKLNTQQITQSCMEWEESIPNEIWNEHFKDNHKEISSELYVDKYRWYETSITVVEIYDRLLGIRHISDLFSESMCVEDCYWELCFMEMEKVQTISYLPINTKNKQS